MFRAFFFSFAAFFLLILPNAAESPPAELILQHAAGVVTAAWDSAETRILSATENGLAQIWSVDDGELLLTLDHGGQPLTHALWVNEDAAILSADESGALWLSTADTGARLQSWHLPGLPIALELNAAGTQALFFSDIGGGALLDLADGARLLEFEAAAEISGAAFSADESRIRAWSEAGNVYSWQLGTGEVSEMRPPHRGLLLGLAWNAADTRVLAWFADGIVNLYESDGLSIGRGRISGLRHNSFVQRAIWSQDETRVMSWAGDDTVHIWSVENGRSQAVYRHEDWVIGARWDQDEESVLSWSHIYVYLWQGEAPPQRFRHNNLLRGAVWNAAGTAILSWSWDGTARVWTVEG